MTENQKAVELVELFREYVKDLQSKGYEVVYSQYTETQNAKHCAEILCDQIIKELKDTVFNYDMDDNFKEVTPTKTTIPYYERVKQELQNI